jgi:hypothetical protein
MRPYCETRSHVDVRSAPSQSRRVRVRVRERARGCRARPSCTGYTADRRARCSSRRPSRLRGRRRFPGSTGEPTVSHSGSRRTSHRERFRGPQLSEAGTERGRASPPRGRCVPVAGRASTLWEWRTRVLPASSERASQSSPIRRRRRGPMGRYLPAWLSPEPGPGGYLSWWEPSP